MSDEMWDAIPGVKNEFIRQAVAEKLERMNKYRDPNEEKTPLENWLRGVKRAWDGRKQGLFYGGRVDQEERIVQGAIAEDIKDLFLDLGEPALPTAAISTRFRKDAKELDKRWRRGSGVHFLLDTMLSELEEGIYETHRRF